MNQFKFVLLDLYTNLVWGRSIIGISQDGICMQVGGIASYFASADYQDKDLKEYQFSDNDTKLNFLIGFDYNFMNNMSMNLEYQSLLGSTKSKEITNSEITHQQELPRFVTFRFGYNFD